MTIDTIKALNDMLILKTMNIKNLQNFILLFTRYFFSLTTLVIHPLFSSDFCTIDHASVSVYAVNSESGKVLIDQNSDLSMIPASCMKVVTTAAALQLLDAKSRFETHLEYSGNIDNTKTLHGSIFIRGGGDPCLGSDRIPGSLSWKKQIEAWATAIQNLGINKIQGKIVGDASKWEKALAVPSWTWEDIGNYYGAGACALSFHENLYTLIFKPAEKVGDKTIILRTEPLLPSHTFVNEVTTGPKGSGDCACIYGSEFSNVQYVRGTIPTGVDEFSIKGAIPDPSAFCAVLLTQELQKRGIIIEKDDKMQESKRISFHTTYSPTIGEIVHWTNQLSINLYAEHLLKKIGEVVYHEGSTASGIKAVTNYWKSQYIDLSGFNMADGSGLSRKNLVTTKQLVEILLKMKKSNVFPIFFESLPTSEVSMRAKSGAMSFINGYVGYVDKIAFAIIVNQCSNQQDMNDKINLFLLGLNKLNRDE